MSGIFGPSSGSYIDVPLLDGETIVRRQAASLLSHGVNMVPGQLVLTNQRLLFWPVNYGGLNKLAQLGLTILPGSGGGALIGAMISAASGYQGGKKGEVPIGQIDSVTVGRARANPINPASLLVNLSNGRAIEIAPYTSLATTSFLPKHAAVRDEMIELIRYEQAKAKR